MTWPRLSSIEHIHTIAVVHFSLASSQSASRNCPRKLKLHHPFLSTASDSLCLWRRVSFMETLDLSRSNISCISFSKVHHFSNNLRAGQIKVNKGNLCVLSNILPWVMACCRYLLRLGEGKTGQQGAWESIHEYLGIPSSTISL